MSFTVTQKVLFRHCDPAGIVFYPRYFEMINDCVEAFFDDKLATPFADLHRAGGVPTVTIETTFKAPSRLGDILEITLTPMRTGRTSLGLNFNASCQDQLRFTASSTLIYVNADNRPEPWPEKLRATLNTMIGDAK